MIGQKIGHQLDPFLYQLIRFVFGNRRNPDFFTWLGFLSTLVASFLLIQDHWRVAGLVILLSGCFDLFDGVVARKSGKVTAFGAFLDSVVDRYSDLFLLLALLIYYLKKGEGDLAILTFVISIGVTLIPYTRARAEALQVQCNIGLMERAERIILFSAGTLFHWMEPVLWIMAILTHFTVLQRIYHVWRTLRASPEMKSEIRISKPETISSDQNSKQTVR
jgi:CDP-diacylglycerol--glycerol-3-phosphate 3-phosphatidyltransferase